MVDRLMLLFKGLSRAHGKYILTGAKMKGKKIEGQAVTVQEPVTVEKWRQHLAGIDGIGIIPILDDSTCYFGAIDIDVYEGLDLSQVASKIARHHLPLIPCRTKSGGLHLFCFLCDPVPAALMREKLFSFAALIGFGESEIFPKQEEVIAERGDLGGWINMPYFANLQGTNRYGINEGGAAMPLQEFIDTAFQKRKTRKEFEAFSIPVTSSISDGPPCLQYLVSQGFPEGTRNEGLFALTVYLKKAFPDAWEMRVDDYNTQFFSPPLSSTEVQAIIKSHKKKDYGFICDKPPCKPHCDKKACLARRYGVAGGYGLNLTALTKHDTIPPIWFVTVDGGGRVELTTEQLTDQTKFQRRCIEAINIMPVKMKGLLWEKTINDLLATVSIIQVPAEASLAGILLEYLEKFCLSRFQAKAPEEILIDKPYLEKGRHLFKLSAFMAYLKRNHIDIPTNKLSHLLYEIGAEVTTRRLKYRNIRIWSVPEFTKEIDDLPIPSVPEKDIV